MEDWIKVTLVLCLFGALKEIRPSEPFVSEFLIGEWRDITEDQLNRDVYPIGTYSYLALLVVVFLITDFLRFKPVIILSGLSGIAVYAILLWTTSLEWLQASQFFYGLYMATDVAYLTYIYAKVDSSRFPIVSSYTRIAALAGRFISGVTAQLLVHYGLMDYRELNYITFAAQILATFWALWLPPVQFGIYFHRKSQINSEQLTDANKPAPTEKQTFHQNVVEASSLIGRHARAAYSRPRVIAWSALYAASLALFVQVQIYMQLLWRQIQDVTGQQVAYNGAVEAAQTLLGAGGAFIASLFSKAVLPAPAAAAQGVAVFVATFVPDVFVSYAGYIVMGTLFHYTITLASAKIASQLCDESCFGLIFGINTLLGTGLQSILTAVLIQSLVLSIYSQYYVISGLLVVLAIFWLLGWIMNSCRQMETVNINSQFDGSKS
ncbi:reduced folate transporter-like [Plodia interpunctella]|uniref:reduced folate transporter-like n=1 Tax=Plodia interpunctella TaxID=58824 RepID=UPI0023678A35|nr:reduced folate transporter-like [Plodia interpunctella]XP_053600899.1 reduced folate transporter-like [Plodia interpunctella]